jgi:MFS family permease
MRIPPKAAALSLLAATQFVLVLDASIVNVALPSIGRDLGVAPEDLSWVVNAYILMFGGFLLLGGRVADYLGHRRSMLAGSSCLPPPPWLGRWPSLACGWRSPAGCRGWARRWSRRPPWPC